MARRGNPEVNDYRKDYWTDRVEPKLDMVTGWARNGLSNEQIALNLGIGESTFQKFIKDHEELEDALYLGREDAEICVENAMFKKATGYTFTELTKERCKRYDEGGKWDGTFIMKTTKKVVKHIQPDGDLIKYWLEHRAPKRWERNPMPGVDTDAVNASIKTLAGLIKNPLPVREIGSEEDDSL